ncbi:MAG: GHKL domain-containing protein [Oscillospiraceae bacterium]
MFIVYVLNYTIIQPVLYALFPLIFLKPRLNDKLTFLIFYVDSLWIGLLYFFIPINMGFSFSYMLSYALLCVLLFQNKLLYRLLFFFSYMGVMMLLETIFILLLTQMFDHIQIKRDFSMPTLFGASFSNTAVVILFVISLWFRKSKYFRLYEKRFINLMVALTGIMAVGISMILMFWYLRLYHTTEAQFYDRVVIAAIICAAIIMLVVVMLRDHAHSSELKQHIAQLEHQKSLEYQYYLNLQESLQQAAKQRHDFSNALQTAYHLIESETEKPAAIEILNEVRDRNEVRFATWFCQNSIINAVLYDKNKTARESGITSEITVKIPETVYISEMDLCSILSNLLDNAIRAAEALPAESRTLRFEIWEERGILFFCTRNSFLQTPNEQGGRYATTKEDASHHGFGHEILMGIAEKYGGTFQIERTDTEFIAVVSAQNYA